MEISITTPALLFPALSLLLLAYSNRFMGLAQIARNMTQSLLDHADERLALQIESLRTRIIIIKYTQASGIMSMLICVIAMWCLFSDFEFLGRISFGASLFFMAVSLLLSFWEIMLSGSALRIELDRLNEKCSAN